MYASKREGQAARRRSWAEVMGGRLRGCADGQTCWCEGSKENCGLPAAEEKLGYGSFGQRRQARMKARRGGMVKDVTNKVVTGRRGLSQESACPQGSYGFRDVGVGG